MTEPRLSPYVRRYTTLSSALETLMKRKIVLLNPAKWDDLNDAYYLELYRNHIGAKSVVALCCTMAAETYHHWKVFTPGGEGVCIEFHRVRLSSTLKQVSGLDTKPVRYKKLSELRGYIASDAEKLPFVKRWGYRDEREWRVFYACQEDTIDHLDVSIDLSDIYRIRLNPWMPPALVTNLRSMIKGIDGCKRLSVVSSSLTNSKNWKEAAHQIFEHHP